YTAKTVIEDVHLLAPTGGVVNGFTERVSGQQFQRTAAMAETHLHRVVIRVANGHEVAVAAERVAERRASSVDDGAILTREHVVLAERSARSAARRYLAWLADTQT